MKNLNEKELKETIDKIWKSSELSKIGKVSDNLYYLGSGCYTSKKGWENFQKDFYEKIRTNSFN